MLSDRIVYLAWNKNRPWEKLFKCHLIRILMEIKQNKNICSPSILRRKTAFVILSSWKHFYMFLTPLKPHFYTVSLGFTGVYINFRISAPKHRPWVIRTASPRRFKQEPTVYVLRRNMKTTRIFHLKVFIFGCKILNIFEKAYFLKVFVFLHTNSH